MKRYLIDEIPVMVRGGWLKTAKLQDEYYTPLESPEEFIAHIRSSPVRADLFTFVQGIHEATPKYSFFHEWDDLAVIPITTYENWLNHQINFKPRNKIRKALKSGVELRVCELTPEFIAGVREIYNETPIRQGQRNYHYGKDLEMVKRELETFLSSSDFIGAYCGGGLIGFAKVTHTRPYSILMHIEAKISHRDKAPTNALIAKAVEVCVSKKMSFLNYTMWGRRPGLNAFKEANGFERVSIPRYFVPLSFMGKLALNAKLHHPLKHYFPDRCIVIAGGLRAKWNEFKYRDQMPKGTGQVNSGAQS